MSVIEVMSAIDALTSVWKDNIFKEKDCQTPNYVIVSITDEKDLDKIPVHFHSSKRLVGVLHLPFIDVPPSLIDPTRTVYEQYGLNNNPFSKEFAYSLIEFVKHYQKGCPNINILVHCEAGVSRSQVIGAFFEVYLNQDYSKLFTRLHDWNLEFFKICLEALIDEDTDQNLSDIAKILLGYEKTIYKEEQMDESLWSPFEEIELERKSNDYLFSKDSRRIGPLYSNSDLVPLKNVKLLERLTNKKIENEEIT